MTKERTYTPKIGDAVHLKSMADYHGHSLEAWSVLHAVGIADGQTTCIRSLTANGEHDGELVTVDNGSIQTPIGWKPRYTITVTADKLELVLGWFRDKRGITVHQSHYMPSCPTAFTPADNTDVGNWCFNGADRETINAADCDELFRVVRLDMEYDAYALELKDCQYCAGTGKHNHNKALDEQHAETAVCPFCGVHLGYSYTLPYHAPGYRYGYAAGVAMDDSQCSQVKPGGECWPCSGTGKAKDYLSGMAPKVRKQAIKALEAQGWKVWYQRSGQLWRMERETVVKDFGCPVPSAEVQANG